MGRGRSGRCISRISARTYDAVYSNLRGDVPARLQIRYEDLKEVNLRIVCCSLSGFGRQGYLYATVNDVAEALRDEHTVARDLIVSTEHPHFGKVTQVGSPVRVGPVQPRIGT